MNRIKRITFFAIGFMIIFSACGKKDSFQNTGKHNPNFNGTIVDYLAAKPEYFTHVSQIVKLSGMENVLRSEKVTFFAPSDSSVRATIIMLNSRLYSQGKDFVTRLSQIKPEVWRKYLARYIFKEVKSLTDYPQIDPQNLSAFPGQIFSSYDGLLMNVGVIYNDLVKYNSDGTVASSVKYGGYRQLQLSYIPSATAPLDYRTWFSTNVASVNVHPTNGYVHVLRYTDHYFGFDWVQFATDAINAGITY